MELSPPVLVAIGAVFLTLIFMVIGEKKEGKSEKVYPIIMGFATGNPPYKVSQTTAAEIAEKAPAVQKIKPLIKRIYGNGRIDYRYMAVPDFSPENELIAGDELLFPPTDDGSDHYKVPVQKRLDRFREKAVPLVTRICEKAIEDSGLSKEDIGKLVVVSSTASRAHARHPTLRARIADLGPKGLCMQIMGVPDMLNIWNHHGDLLLENCPLSRRLAWSRCVLWARLAQIKS